MPEAQAATVSVAGTRSDAADEAGAEPTAAPVGTVVPVATVANPLTYAEVLNAEGRSLPVSSWVEVPQSRIDAFAACTGDDQWIHVDTARAATGPFGGTIAHGYLTLSLLVPMLVDVGLFPDDGTTVVNYGLDGLRYLAPVPSGSRVRLRSEVRAVRPKGDDRTLATVHCEVELEAVSTPALVADVLLLFVREPSGATPAPARGAIRH